MNTVEASNILRGHGFGVVSYQELSFLRGILAYYIEHADHEFGDEPYVRIESRIDGELLGIDMARLEKAKAT